MARVPSSGPMMSLSQNVRAMCGGIPADDPGCMTRKTGWNPQAVEFWHCSNAHGPALAAPRTMTGTSKKRGPLRTVIVAVPMPCATVRPSSLTLTTAGLLTSYIVP